MSEELDPVAIPITLPKDAQVHVKLPNGDVEVHDGAKLLVIVHARHVRTFKAQLKYLLEHFDQNLDPRLK